MTRDELSVLQSNTRNHLLIWKQTINSNLEDSSCIAMIRLYKCTNTWNIRNVHMHRNPAKHLTTFFSSGTKLLLPSWLLGFQHEERATQFLLCWLFYLTPPCAAHLVDPSGLASPRSKNQLASPRSESQLNAFFQKSPKILGPSLPGMTSFTSSVLFPIGGFYYDIYDCHTLPVRVWTPALNMCPTHALIRTVLSPTKPKDKI